MTGETKIYTVFTSKGYSGAGGAPRKLLTNEEVLERLRAECGAVDFLTRDLSKGLLELNAVLRELDSLRGDIDGVLVFGITRREEYALALTGLPTIVVYNLFEFMHIPYELYYKRGGILTTCVDRLNAASPAVSGSMFQDLVRKVKLIEVLRKMKGSRIISVSPYKDLAIVDYKRLPPGYNRVLTKALKEYLGVELLRIEPEEFYDAVRSVKEDEAGEIAKGWIQEAAAVTDTTESEVVKSAKMYLAFKSLMEKYKAVAITTHMRSLTGSGKQEDLAWPSLGNTELQKYGKVGLCQDYPHIAATHLMGLYLTGRPSMLGDLMIDPFNEVSIVLHCGAPINPRASDRVPFVIRSHAESPVRGTMKPGSGAASQVELPVGESVTVWKIDVVNRRILVHTGTSVDPHSLYEGVDDIMCRTKSVIKTDTGKVQRHFHMDRYGLHRAVTYGDLRESIRDLATLIGFQVVEEDR